MTPDLLEEGSKRREAYIARLAANRTSGDSGGQAASFGHVVTSDVVDTSNGGILYVDDITVSFDGFRALNKLTLNIAVGELRCIIGPNGAGKTTMMDVITGKTKPIAVAHFSEPTSICFGCAKAKSLVAASVANFKNQRCSSN